MADSRPGARGGEGMSIGLGLAVLLVGTVCAVWAMRPEAK